MRKKLEGNGLWESSRRVLPEYRASIQRGRQRLQRRNRNQLDELELELIRLHLLESLERKTAVTIRVYHPYDDQIVIGCVEHIHVGRQRILVAGYWIGIADIEAVEPC